MLVVGLDMVMNAFNPSGLGQPGLHRETLSQRKKNA